MKNKKIIIKSLFLILFILLFSYSNFAQPSSENLNLKKLEKYIKKSFKSWEIPGMAIAIVKDGKIIYKKGFGVKDINKKDKVDDETLFAIASNTKAFTSAALSKLVAEGKISWDDKVKKYLPYFQLYDTYASNEMTIRDLLCHRSGLKTFSGDLLWYASNHSREQIIKRAKYLKPAYSFRSHYGYSNIMYLTAGEIIPIITGKSWDDYIRTNFFKPLGMKNSNTTIRDFKKNGNIAQPHHVVFGKKAIKIPYVNWDNIAPAGSINSNIVDMAEWIKMWLNNGMYNGEQILDKNQIWEMRSPQTIINVSQGYRSIWNMTHFKSYGLGWAVYDYHGKKVTEHGGGADGMISKVAMIPEEKFGFVILTNSINILPSALTYYILDMYLTGESRDWATFYLNYYKNDLEKKEKEFEEKDKTRNKNSKPSLELKEYTGTYGGKMYGNATIELKNNKLELQFIPTPLFIGTLEHWQYNTFSIKMNNFPGLPTGFVNFIINKDGKIEEMDVDIPNPDFDFTELEFKKIK